MLQSGSLRNIHWEHVLAMSGVLIFLILISGYIGHQIPVRTIYSSPYNNKIDFSVIQNAHCADNINMKELFVPSGENLPDELQTVQKWEKDAYLISFEKDNSLDGTSPTEIHIYASNLCKNHFLVYTYTGTSTGFIVNPVFLTVDTMTYPDDTYTSLANLLLAAPLEQSATVLPSFVYPSAIGPIIYMTKNAFIVNNKPIPGADYYGIQVSYSSNYGVFYKVLFYTYKDGDKHVIEGISISHQGKLISLTQYAN